MSEPELDDVDGAWLLDGIAAFIERFLVLPDGVLPLLSLWVVHTHAFAAAEYTPYVVVSSPTKGCGKSRLLEVLALVASNPQAAANATPAALYRCIKVGAEPTLFLDEQDGIRDDDVRRVLNAGFRRGGTVMRTSRDLKGVERFPAFCPKALASIGEVTSTVADRAVQVRMTRRLATESVEPFRPSELEPESAPLHDAAATFAGMHLDELSASRPEFPGALDDRGRDIYAPLFAIADLAGGTWASDARKAAVANRAIRSELRDDYHTELLRDIRALLERRKGTHVSSKALVIWLNEDDSLRWQEWSHNRGLTPRSLAMILRDFGIRTSVQQIGGVQKHRYRRADLEDAFVRYLGVPASEGTGEAGDGSPTEVRLPEEPTSPFSKTRAQREEERKLTEDE